MSFLGSDDVKHAINLLTNFARQKKINKHNVKELENALLLLNEQPIRSLQPAILSTVALILRELKPEHTHFRAVRYSVTGIFINLVKKATTGHITPFRFIYKFLLSVIYDPEQANCVAVLDEEFKLIIMQCMDALMKSSSWNVLKELYEKENVPELCQMIFIAVELAKNERMRILRITALECLMSMAYVNDEAYYTDVDLRHQVASIFMFFIPGVAKGLRQIAVEDEKCGHKIVQMAVRAWGRIIALQMQHYNLNKRPPGPEEERQTEQLKKRWKNQVEVRKYIEDTNLTRDWYKQTDKNLECLMSDLAKLTYHSHPKVRLELAHACLILIKNCFKTIPKTIAIAIEINITLSADDEEMVATEAKNTLRHFSTDIFTHPFQAVFDNLEQNFSNVIVSFPRVFNGLGNQVFRAGYIRMCVAHAHGHYITADEEQQISLLNLLIGYLRFSSWFYSNVCFYLLIYSQHIQTKEDIVTHAHGHCALTMLVCRGVFLNLNLVPNTFNVKYEEQQISLLNLLIGYLRLFGKNRLKHILHSPFHLQKLILTLVHVCAMEQTQVTLLEEYGIQDLDLSTAVQWKNFRYLRNSKAQAKFEQLCHVLSECDIIDIIADVLTEIYSNDSENKKEATLILNEVLRAANPAESLHVVKNVVNLYLDKANWQLQFNDGNIGEMRNNVMQICLQVEGISKIASNQQKEFVPFLIQTLYPILECAGSGQPLMKAVGIAAIQNISTCCGYASVSELINVNSDYFAFHVVRKIHRAKYNEQVLNVLAAVMRHSGMEVLPSISDIVSGVLMQTCDNFFQEQNSNAYLRVFNIFIQCLMRWLRIKAEATPIKSKQQKEAEYQQYYVTGANADPKADEDEGKSAEEMFKEDMQKQREDLEKEWEDDVEAYKKPEPTLHVTLTCAILKRCVHFLPSKDRARKLLVLEILRNGLEIIRDWEDELLPLVHQIWSPLVARFNEDHVLINYSFQLLVTLARLSKDFIRSRTVKDVLPQLLTNLTALAKESYLKDKGSSYRYTQAYKLQLVLVEHFAGIVIELDMTEQDMNACVDAVIPYLSDKQPLPLQNRCRRFFKDLTIFDPDLVKAKLATIVGDEFARNLDIVKQQ